MDEKEPLAGAVEASVEELEEFKRLRREKDARDLASGVKTAEQLMFENGFFAVPKDGSIKVVIHYR